MPEIGAPTFGEEPRKESPGEAAYRLGLWWLSIWKIFGVKFSSRHEDAAAVLAMPFIRRWPVLAKWKASK